MGRIIAFEKIRFVAAPANEEVDGTRNRPSPNISTSIHRPIKMGTPVTSPKNSGLPVKIFSLLLPVPAPPPGAVRAGARRGSIACLVTDTNDANNTWGAQGQRLYQRWNSGHIADT